MKYKKPKEGVVIDTAQEEPKQISRFNPEIHIRSDLLENMSLNDLLLQHSLMQKRLRGAGSIANIQMQQSIQRGIDVLLSLIEEKSVDVRDDNLIF